MKTTLTTILCIVGLFVMAQVSNGNFENWRTDTVTWGYSTYVPVDTFPTIHPTDWTTMNAATNNRYLGGKSLVFQDSTPKFGSYNVKLKTDSLKINVSGATLTATLPALLVNGIFPIDLNTLISGSNVSPIALVGAGEPITGVKKSFSLWVKYTPVLNDSMLIWAVLKNGSTVVADVKFNHSSSDTGYVLLQKDFVYHSCLTPDTAIILIASSTPNFSSLLNSITSGLKPGSIALVDSVALEDFAGGESVGPIAINDAAYTFQDSFKNVVVLANDTDCHGTIDSVKIQTAPLHGTAVVQADKSITYTPDSGYTGLDSFYYVAKDSFGVGVASVRMSILSRPLGIANYHTLTATVFPNPAINSLSIETPYLENANILVFNVVGKQLLQQNYTGTISLLPTDKLTDGLYILQIKNSNGQVIATNKFAVQH